MQNPDSINDSVDRVTGRTNGPHENLCQLTAKGFAVGTSGGINHHNRFTTLFPGSPG